MAFLAPINRGKKVILYYYKLFKIFASKFFKINAPCSLKNRGQKLGLKSY